jgi:diguanylate cyclase (GGDEF)-like protein
MGTEHAFPSTTSVLMSARSSKEPSPRRLRGGIVAAVIVVLVFGTLGSLIAARAVDDQQSARAERAFATTSTAIAAALKLAIQRDDDLLLSGASFVFAGAPKLSNPRFIRWATSMHVLRRYPELLGFGSLVIVPASALKAFEARALLHRPTPLGAHSTFQIVPPGRRAFYCLGQVGMVRDVSAPSLENLDFCRGQLGPSLLDARDSGQGSYVPFTLANGAHELVVQLPVYRGGDVPPTLAARHSAFMGWFGTYILPQELLKKALIGHPHTVVTFHYHRGASDAVFTSGPIAEGTRSETIDLHNGWTVRTSGVVATPGLFGSAAAVALLIAGIAMSLLISALVLVLGTGHVRALRLVGERTGELRHQLITDRIQQILARNRRNRTTGAALYVDLDEFKNVNDMLGHEAGDRLLIAVATRLESTLREADTIGRMGGDEFIVLIDGASVEVAPELVAERLLNVMRQPFTLEGAPMPMIATASIGIAIGDRATPGDLLRDADVALYQAKAAGKNRYEIFHPEMQIELSQRIELEFDLRSALDGNQFRLVYQPIYDLDDLSLVAVEALLRWDHPTRGLVQPDEFIPVLEQTGQIREVGRWVLREACRQTATWHALGDTMDISVNVSGRQLDNDGIVQDIDAALTASGLDARCLNIEVTETALMRSAEATARRLHAIRELGVSIAVDDFGTGYSSLAYLRQFPVECLKIDRTFTNAITVSPESKDLIRTFVQLGKDLGLKTLAEGVETVGEMDHLRSEHVDQAQGFLFALPLDPQTLETQLLAPSRPLRAAAQRP